MVALQGAQASARGAVRWSHHQRPRERELNPLGGEGSGPGVNHVPREQQESD